MIDVIEKNVYYIKKKHNTFMFRKDKYVWIR